MFPALRRSFTFTTQEVFHISEQIEIAADSQYTTPCSQRELIYRDEDPGAKYELEMLVDLSQELIELDKGNNFKKIDWWTISPSAAQKTSPFKIEVPSQVTVQK